MAIMVYIPDGSFAFTVLVIVFARSGGAVVVGIGLTLYIVVGVAFTVVGVIWVVGGEMVCCMSARVEEVTGMPTVVGVDIYSVVGVVGLMVVDEAGIVVVIRNVEVVVGRKTMPGSGVLFMTGSYLTIVLLFAS